VRYPRLQQQFNPRDSTSYADCCACSAGMLADADSKGKIVYDHAQVRRATNEPIPDNASPGLSWNQVDAALYQLSAGRINLDVHPTGSSFAPIPPALRAGKWAGLAVWRGVLVDAGLGFSSPFRKGHAIVAAYEQDRKVPIIGDPLVDHWIDVTWALLERACRAFVVSTGAGQDATGAYYALTRDVYDVPTSTLHYSALFTAGSFWRYERMPSGVFTRESKRFSAATSAPCLAPISGVFNGTHRKLNEITRGVLKGYYVESGTTNVTVKVTK
jgi:hypothetical protein